MWSSESFIVKCVRAREPPGERVGAMASALPCCLCCRRWTGFTPARNRTASARPDPIFSPLYPCRRRGERRERYAHGAGRGRARALRRDEGGSAGRGRGRRRRRWQQRRWRRRRQHRSIIAGSGSLLAHWSSDYFRCYATCRSLSRQRHST